MGCVVVKQAVSVTPAIEHSVESEKNNRKKKTESVGASRSELGESGRASSNGGSESLSFRLGNLSKYVEGEQAAAGWPAWLSAVACEAIHGWVPLRADAFEKLDKVRINKIMSNYQSFFFFFIHSSWLTFTHFCSCYPCLGKSFQFAYTCIIVRRTNFCFVQVDSYVKYFITSHTVGR